MKTSRPIAYNALQAFVSEYLPQTYRIKGFVKLDTGKHVAVQSSYDQVSYYPVDSFTGNTEIIAMGDKLDIKAFSKRFRAFIS